MPAAARCAGLRDTAPLLDPVVEEAELESEVDEDDDDSDDDSDDDLDDEPDGDVPVGVEVAVALPEIWVTRLPVAPALVELMEAVKLAGSVLREGEEGQKGCRENAGQLHSDDEWSRREVTSESTMKRIALGVTSWSCRSPLPSDPERMVFPLSSCGEVSSDR
ncbi:hypothetical protein VMCG_06795 [Cytospora schulzeri]|uniref:Uncharacterized protein n=1 Tax=Cytospora schulzeri TaxID=448051 RepID=A0A423W5U5_9PEZI|nr:hypothetical protein VMCG_06795 [Valsa malicola]